MKIRQLLAASSLLILGEASLFKFKHDFAVYPGECIYIQAHCSQAQTNFS
jgi:hypothetical protein